MAVLVIALTPGAVLAVTPTPVTVGAAASFAVLAGVTSTASVTSTPDDIIYGNMGSGSTPVLPNFVCGTLFTQIPPPIPATLTNAYADATSVRGQINTPPQPAPIVLTADLGGTTLTPGVYAFGTSAGVAAATTVTFDAQGDPNALFVVQVGTSLVVSGGVNMILENGAQACNVYWRVGTSATIAGNVHFVGTLSAGTSITVAALASVDGRLWANNDVTLAANVTVQTPCVLTTTKTPDVTSASVGQVITYTVVITNNSPCGAMTISSVVDTIAGDVTADFPSSVPASGSVSGTYTYAVQAGDPNPLRNLVTVTATASGGTPTVTLPFTSTAAASVPLGGTASIGVTKTADRLTASPGDTINYTITVTNTGSITLNSLTVTDSLLGPLAGYGTTLAPGASVTNTFPYVVQPGDPNPLVNVVTASAIPQGQTTPVSGTASASVAIQTPGMTITKTADVTTATAGQTITYTITINNTGGVTLNSITVTDPLLGGTLAGFPSSLAPGGSASNTFMYVVPPGATNPLVNTATFSATPQGGSPQSTTASASVLIVSPSGLLVTKTANVQIAKPGDVIIYTITIRNLGNLPVSGITVIDPMLGCVLPGFPDSLCPQAAASAIFTYTVRPCDSNPLVNTVTFTATPRCTCPESISATASVTIQHPRLCVCLRPSTYCAKPGDTITFTLWVTNLGDVPLNGIVQSNSLTGLLPTIPTEAPGDTHTTTFTYQVQPTDCSPLFVSALVTGTVDDSLMSISNIATTCIEIVRPQLCVTKTADRPGAFPGQPVNYTVTIRNTGNVTLTDITAMDSLVGPLTLPCVTLMPGELESTTYCYTVTMSDPNPLLNTVTVLAEVCGCPTEVVSGSATASIVVCSLDGLSQFSDVPAIQWAFDSIEACVAKGIVQGYADGSYDPGGSVDRAADGRLHRPRAGGRREGGPVGPGHAGLL